MSSPFLGGIEIFFEVPEADGMEEDSAIPPFSNRMYMTEVVNDFIKHRTLYSSF